MGRIAHRYGEMEILSVCLLEGGLLSEYACIVLCCFAGICAGFALSSENQNAETWKIGIN